MPFTQEAWNEAKREAGAQAFLVALRAGAHRRAARASTPYRRAAVLEVTLDGGPPFVFGNWKCAA
jgi:hypothetical protein